MSSPKETGTFGDTIVEGPLSVEEVRKRFPGAILAYEQRCYEVGILPRNFYFTVTASGFLLADFSLYWICGSWREEDSLTLHQRLAITMGVVKAHRFPLEKGVWYHAQAGFLQVPLTCENCYAHIEPLSDFWWRKIDENPSHRCRACGASTTEGLCEEYLRETVGVLFLSSPS